MKLLNLLALILALVFNLTSSVKAGSTKTKPNIIIVITDDQGKNDLACEGNPYIITPNIDKFYNNAVRFTNFHVSTTCAPTRGALMTGRHTNRLNVFHTIAGRSLLFEDEVLLPQILAQNGYTNGMFGKWHLGDNYPFRPMDRGFHEVIRHGGGGIGQIPDYWGNDYFDDTYWHNGELQAYEGYCTDVFFSEALKFIEANKDKPFFCYISTNAPHGPYNCPQKYIDLYEGNEKLPESIKRFYGMITNIDDNFKVLREKLDEWSLAENTILVFMTDNGTAGGQKIYDAGMTGGKGSVTEGGHRTPFYIQWPAKGIEGGKDIDQLTAHYDVVPTLVELMGLKYTSSKALDGKSWLPLLKGQAAQWPNRVLYMDTQREQNLCKYRRYTVMDKDWRLVNGEKLYCVTKDLKQEKNVIDEYPEIAEKLALGYEKWWQSFVDEGVNEKYAYIKVGTPFENPARLTSHDMMTGKPGNAWHQHAAITATQTSGVWKVEVVESGKYKISLRRFGRESDLKINATFAAEETTRRIERPAPASTKSDFTEVFLYVGEYTQTVKLKGNEEEVAFVLDISEGKYNLQAELIDAVGCVHPSYFLYIEKL